MKIYGGLFEPDLKKNKILKLEKEVSSENFWNDRKNSEKVINELNYLKKQLNDVEAYKKEILSCIEMLEFIKEEYDDEIKLMLENRCLEIGQALNLLEIELLLNGKYDKFDALIEIHSGAGGTEACDWAMMLKRMYLRWCDDKNYKLEIIDEQLGEEVGIKSSTILVHGLNSYGYLKNEKGVHRLIRLSLFDNNDVNIVINENDLRIDVYRSSGCGGQGVNTTDSAVRITHLPTKIVVTCQNERSQIQNKEKALEILKNKLYQLELDKQQNDLKEFRGELKDINFGSQIRSYVMHPYSLVKDHRTNIETSNVSKVLDGSIDMFITASLKRRV